MSSYGVTLGDRNRKPSPAVPRPLSQAILGEPAGNPAYSSHYVNRGYHIARRRCRAWVAARLMAFTASMPDTTLPNTLWQETPGMAQGFGVSSAP